MYRFIGIYILYVCVRARAGVRACMCGFLGEREGGGGTPHMHGHTESNKDLNLKKFDLRVGPHEYK